MVCIKAKEVRSSWGIWTTGLLLAGCIAATVTPAYSFGGQAGGGAPAVQLTVSPGSLAFDSQLASQTQAFSEDVSVASIYNSMLPYDATIQTGSEWLVLADVVAGAVISRGNSVSSSTPGVLRIIVNTQNLQPGIHYGTIAISAHGIPNAPALLPVTLNLRAYPTITFRPNALNFSYQSGNNLYSPPSQVLSVFGDNTNISVLLSTDTGVPWLSVTPASSTTPTDLTVSVNPAGLLTGSYQGTITIVAPNTANSGLTIPVVLAVTSSTSGAAAPNSISLQAQYGSHEPVSQSLSIYTNGDPFQVSAPTGNQAWLSAATIDPWAGATEGGTGKVLLKPAKLTVSADPTGLPVGTYSGVMSIRDPSSGITVPVTLQINPNDLAFPQIADGGGWSTTITLVNTDAQPSPFVLKFWRSDGTPLLLPLEGVGSVSEYSDTIAVGGTRILKTAGLGSSISQGWAELIAQGSIGGTAIFRQQSDFGESEAAVLAASSLGTYFLLPFDNTSGFQTGIAVVNTGLTESTISMDFQAENQDVLASDSITLPPHGSTALLLSGKYPQVAGRRGVLVFSATSGDTSLLGLRFSPGGSFTSFQPVVPQPASAGASMRTVSQVADGSGWKTTLVLANPGTKPAPFSIVFRDPTLGTPVEMPLAVIGNRAEYSDVIPAGGVRVFETEGMPGTMLTQAWAQIVSSSPVGGTVIFAQAGNSGSGSEAALQILPPIGERFVLPFDYTSGFTTGLALLNQSQTDNYLCTVTVRDESGQRLTTQYMQLNALTDVTFMLADRFPSALDFRGSIEFSGAAISALGLLFNPAGSFTSLEPMRK